MIRIIVKTEPVARGRPKTAFRNGFLRTYTPRKTQIAQAFLNERFARHIKECFPQHTPVKLTAVFYRTKSKWLPKRETMPFRKPDLDNFLGLLMNALNGILVADDAQITSIKVAKRWSDKGYGYIAVKLEEDSL